MPYSCRLHTYISSFICGLILVYSISDCACKFNHHNGFFSSNCDLDQHLAVIQISEMLRLLRVSLTRDVFSDGGCGIYTKVQVRIASVYLTFNPSTCRGRDDFCTYPGEESLNNKLAALKKRTSGQKLRPERLTIQSRGRLYKYLSHRSFISELPLRR